MDKCCCHNPCCPAPVPAEPIDFYAQYGTSYNGASGTYVSFFPVFQEGDGIRLENDTTISLKPGYLYLIDFIFLGTAEADGYMQILPYINGSPPSALFIFCTCRNRTQHFRFRQFHNK